MSVNYNCGFNPGVRRLAIDRPDVFADKVSQRYYYKVRQCIAVKPDRGMNNNE